MEEDSETVTPPISSLIRDLDPEELSDYLVAKFNFKVEDISCFQGIL